jgi:hypothetical protein
MRRRVGHSCSETVEAAIDGGEAGGNRAVEGLYALHVDACFRGG